MCISLHLSQQPAKKVGFTEGCKELGTVPLRDFLLGGGDGKWCGYSRNPPQFFKAEVCSC